MPVLLQNQVSLTLKEFLEAGALLVPLLNVHLSNTAWNKQGISPFLQCTTEHKNKKAGGFTLQISNSLNNSGMHVYPGRIEPYSLSVRNYIQIYRTSREVVCHGTRAEHLGRSASNHITANFYTRWKREQLREKASQ